MQSFIRLLKLAARGSWLLPLALPLHAADVSGTWAASLDSPLGYGCISYSFTVQGSALTGTVKSAEGEREIEQGRLDGDVVTFVEYWMLDGTPTRVLTAGRIVAPDTIRMSRMIVDVAVEAFTARRADSAPDVASVCATTATSTVVGQLPPGTADLAESEGFEPSKGFWPLHP